MNHKIDFFMTSREIGLLTQTPHKYVKKRACEKLLEAGIDPNGFWDDWTDPETGITKKVLHLPKAECMLAINHSWYSFEAMAAVLDVWNIWTRNNLPTEKK